MYNKIYSYERKSKRSDLLQCYTRMKYKLFGKSWQEVKKKQKKNSCIIENNLANICGFYTYNRCESGMFPELLVGYCTYKSDYKRRLF